VPSAFEFPGQASVDAQADPPITAREMNRKKKPAKRIRTRILTFVSRLIAPKVELTPPERPSHALKNATSLGRKKAVPPYPGGKKLDSG
jgi:hypothetical protein